jgi:diguanylate cyclase (GGDEF)-like protein/PAS domain S-box-containing protein
LLSGLAIVYAVLYWSRRASSTRGAALDGRSRLLARLHLASSLAAVAAICIGLAVFFGGWIFGSSIGHISFLKTILPGAESMKANTALGLAFLGAALFLHSRGEVSHRTRLIASLFAGITTLIGALTVLEYLTRRNLHIDQLLINDYVIKISKDPPGRMSITTAISFVLLGCALLFPRNRRGILASQSFALAASGLCLVNLIARLYGIQNFQGIAFYTAIAFHTSLTLFILALGVLCSTAHAGWMATVTSEKMGGVLARRLLPAALLPIALGWLRWQGQFRGYYDDSFGIVLAVSAAVAIFTLLIWVHCELLNRLDRERLASFQKLKAREADFQQLANSVPHLVYTARADGWFDYCNQRWIDYTGLTLEQSQGGGSRAAIHPDDVQSVVDGWNHTVATGLTAELQFRLRRASDGVYRWHLGRIVPMHDAAGKIVKWFGTSTDIDDYKRVQHALEESRQQLEARVHERTAELEKSNTLLNAILDSMADGVICINDKYEHVLCNNAARKLGSGPQQTNPERRAEAFGIYHADKKTLFKPEELPLGRALRGENCDNVEVFGIHPDLKDQRWFSCNSRPMRDSSGKVYSAVLVTHDITERKLAEEALVQSEERFRLIVESVQDYAILMLDCGGRVATWNAGAQRINGYSADEIVGKHFSIFHIPEESERKRAEALLRTAAQSGRFEEEGWRVRKNGERFYAQALITALRDKTGTLRGFSKITRDITEKKRLEETKNRLLEILEETSDFVGTARPDGTVLYANRALRRLRGLREGQSVESLRVEGTYPPRVAMQTLLDALQTAIQYGTWSGETIFQYHSGEELPVSQIIMSHRNSDGELEFLSTIARDISEVKHKEAQLELVQEQLEASLTKERELSRQDPLTGLANRRAFLETSEIEKDRSRRYHHCFNIAYIDLDGFKKVNDTLGHAVGDQVLIAVADTLRSNLRSTDAVARLGGDEFAVLLTETDAASAEKVLRKLHELLRAAMKKHGWNVDCSIGLASYLCPPESMDNIIRTADGLMYSVKANGKGALAVALLA